MTYFSHQIDDATKFCTRCGRHLADLQRKTVWIGNAPHPKCEPGVVGISHIVRKREVAL